MDSTNQNGGTQVYPIWKKEGKNLTPCIYLYLNNYWLIIKLADNVCETWEHVFKVLQISKLHWSIWTCCRPLPIWGPLKILDFGKNLEHFFVCFSKKIVQNGFLGFLIPLLASIFASTGDSLVYLFYFSDNWQFVYSFQAEVHTQTF
jgi:hypothetical protein